MSDLSRELLPIVERFCRGKLAEGSSPETVEQDRKHLSVFFRFLEERIDPPPSGIGEISSEHLLAYRDHLLTRPRQKPSSGLLSSSTVSNHIAALKGFFAFALEADLLLLDPARHVKYPKARKRLPRRVPTVRQMRRLLSCAGQERALSVRDVAILELFYGTGLRNAELCGLDIADYDVARGVLLVRKGKGGRQRMVPLGEKAKEALERYLVLRAASGKAQEAEASALFLSRFGGRLTPGTVRQAFVRIASRAGLSKKFSPHSLRHACATHLLRGRADIRHIQELLGHASLESTQIYTRLEVTDLARVLKRCHPREQLP